ncbi:MAG TPA: hypothetical protein PKH24_20560 [Sedimentisphaerales bacterium]|nr:hypothetical protein [Sedimentisphaerales bacterium]HNU31582.1 hypothetical protein [Sedimentisphaerales bacterium]
MELSRVVLCLVFTILALCAFDSVRGQVPAAVDSRPQLPGEWAAAWREPPAPLRPLQIVHGIPAPQATISAMTALRDLGLGGIVCNVNFSEYLVSDAHWQTLVQAVEACRDAGLVVWIYDEDGYPSAAAGGLVLKRNPAYEALALTWDPSRPEPFALRPSYEHTHASNNYYAARRYPNLIDEQAMRCFIEVTHQAYWTRLKDHFGTTIQAFFTDEPSLMAVNLGPLPDDVRTKVRVADPLDPNVKPLPSVPWVADLPVLYQQRYGEDLMSVRRSLFDGTSESDRRVRRQFWSLIADLTADRYFGQIRRWSHEHSVASSGHTLWEETPLHHVPLEGNALKALRQMDIPGLDLLTSDPEAVIHSGWMTAILPASAAILNGTRRVMTEVSDFSQTMAGQGPASVDRMQATAAWQAALGVTEFTLYYGYHQRQPDEYRQYCGYVGRLNAVLREARLAPCVLLYYPIYDLWPEYRPVGEKLTQDSQSPRLKQIVNSFLALGQKMTRRQIPFALIDHESLAGAEVRDGRLLLAGHRFAALVLPTGAELPESCATVVDRFKAARGKVFSDGPAKAAFDMESLLATVPDGRLTVPSERIVIGRFSREGRDVRLVVNVGAEPYAGAISLGTNGQWLAAHPGTGQIEWATTTPSGEVALTLPARGAVLLVSTNRTGTEAPQR